MFYNLTPISSLTRDDHPTDTHRPSNLTECQVGCGPGLAPEAILEHVTCHKQYGQHQGTRDDPEENIENLQHENSKFI